MTDRRLVRRLARRLVRGLAATLAAVLVVLLALLVWAQFSPRPSVWLINLAFASGGVGDTSADPPAEPVEVRTDLAYGDGRDETFDLYLPADAERPAPVVVWVHGGGWIGGDKSQPGPYLQLLAARGVAGMSINYSVAPGANYPVPVEQTDRAVSHLLRHAAELGLDPDRVVLAGDSAGAQIAGQYANVVTNPDHARDLGIEPALAPEQLRGALLHCGPYRPKDALGATGVAGWFVRTVGWAYLGDKNLDSPAVDQASVTDHATASYPPTLLSGGDLDPLTAQGRGLESRLDGLDVSVEGYWYPGLNHEFQFDLSLPESQAVLAQTYDFLDRTVLTP